MVSLELRTSSVDRFRRVEYAILFTYFCHPSQLIIWIFYELEYEIESDLSFYFPLNVNTRIKVVLILKRSRWWFMKWTYVGSRKKKIHKQNIADKSSAMRGHLSLLIIVWSVLYFLVLFQFLLIFRKVKIEKLFYCIYEYTKIRLTSLCWT